MRPVRRTFFVLCVVLGLRLMGDGWHEAGEGLRGMVAGLIVGLVLGSVGALFWLAFSPEEEPEEKPEKKVR